MKSFALFLFLCSTLLANRELANRLFDECPQWIDEAIHEELAPYHDKTLSKTKLNELFRLFPEARRIVKVTILNNRISTESFALTDGQKQRIKTIKKSLEMIGRFKKLPDTTFYFSVHDGVYEDLASRVHPGETFPIFTMCKTLGAPTILIPDYQALTQNFQVLKNRDLTEYVSPWDNKIPLLVWRGSVGQHTYNNRRTQHTPDNLQMFSRVKLCELSRDYPHLINAKFTVSGDLEKSVPYLATLKGDWLSFEEQFTYKYHLLIDGGVSAYGHSFWKLLTNSLLFKTDSTWVQWYYRELKPYVHYVPVKEDLVDLVEKIEWAKTHDSECEQIALNAHNFALSHLLIDDQLIYLYFLIKRYSELNFVN